MRYRFPTLGDFQSPAVSTGPHARTTVTNRPPTRTCPRRLRDTPLTQPTQVSGFVCALGHELG